MPPSNRVVAIQREAWAFGRQLRASTLAQYEDEYGEKAPPPALIGPEILRDFLGAKVTYDPLPLNLFAETTVDAGAPWVTINSLTARIDGVKDASGVQNVGVWHEAIHVVRDLHSIRVGPQAALPGMPVNPKIACHREKSVGSSRADWAREYFAEEAGRAAAVSYPHLLETPAFQQFIERAQRRLASTASCWPLLYKAAEQIGVNISALTKQLQEEGLLVIERHNGRPILYPQPALWNLMVVSE